MQKLVLRSSRLLANSVTLRLSVQGPRRFVSENSWAADQLSKKGEKLTPGVEGDMLVTESLVHKPSPKVKELAEKFLELNAVEAAQLLKVIQVIWIENHSFSTI